MTMNRIGKNFLSDIVVVFGSLHAALTEYIVFEGRLAHYVKTDIGDIYRRFTFGVYKNRLIIFERERKSRLELEITPNDLKLRMRLKSS